MEFLFSFGNNLKIRDMKIKYFLTIFLLVIFCGLQAQFLEKLKNSAKKSAERAVERKVEQKSSKTTEDAMDKVLGNKKSSSNDSGSTSKSKKKNNSLEEDDDSSLSEDGENTVGFKRGSRIVFQDDFSKDAIGDFPAKWNTSKSGEVKNLKGFSNRFLKVTAGTVVNPELTKPLPENFTIEFDLILPSAHPYRRPGIGFGTKPEKIDYLLGSNNAVTFDIMSAEIGSQSYKSINYNEKSLGYTKEEVAYTAPLDKVIKIAYEANGKRIRMFVNGKKMVDLPTQFKPEYRKAFYLTSITSGWKETEDAYFYIGNLVIAETGKDERSAVLKDLMEKGNFSTNAILFASGSDKIQAESNAIISQIYDALSQAPDMKIKIVGHTDSDGDNNSNLALSKKRANAVKMKLASMGIDASRMTTDGKGENEPVSDNDSASGKAQNRRVEFIKL